MTKFIPIPGTQQGAEWLVKERRDAIVIVARHGLGDLVFFSPCFKLLSDRCGRQFFCSSVNAYATIFEASEDTNVIYAGGANGNSLKLDSCDDFVRQLERFELDLGVEEAFVYQFGVFEPPFPYSDERAFVKGRRNLLEFGLGAPGAATVPEYHVAPATISREYVQAVIRGWLPERKLIVLARYGHTHPDKNFEHGHAGQISLTDGLEKIYPGKYKFITFDYAPGGDTCDGHRPNVRSVYGFLPCDAASGYHILAEAELLVTVPTGPMLVGSTIAGLKMLTLWKTMLPFRFLDPQGGRKVWAMVERPELMRMDFSRGWPKESRDALAARWNLHLGPINAETVLAQVVRILEGEWK